ncbi:hypothetical protein V6C31_03840, partial [Caldibacillus debilis]
HSCFPPFCFCFGQCPSMSILSKGKQRGSFYISFLHNFTDSTLKGKGQTLYDDVLQANNSQIVIDEKEMKEIVAKYFIP